MCRLLLVLVFASACLFAASDGVERGKYLVEEIGKYQDCHTPRGAYGQFDRLKAEDAEAIVQYLETLK